LDVDEGNIIREPLRDETDKETPAE